MSYALYVGKNHSRTGHAWMAGYGDEPSSHWLEIVPAADHAADASFEAGIGPDADMPGHRITVPQAGHTLRHMRVSYSYYLGVPAPITNGGVNEAGVAVRDVWSTSRAELRDMTTKDQAGLNYSDLARCALERASSARGAVELCASLIAQHGEATYGGNSHFFADRDEAWVMIQFAGGQGLWVAERLGADSIRASRPGYVLEVPVDDPDHPDFLYSPNFVSFAREQGWYKGGPFDANAIYGDGKGRWDGIKWIETEMQARAARPEKIGLDDMIWAVRTEKLTGDTAGYGQVVPLAPVTDPALILLWHAACGALAAPFSPVFLGQNTIAPEYGPHRYLTAGESHRFMDMRKAVSGGVDTVSLVPQQAETTVGAFQDSKRLMYLMQLIGPESIASVHPAFVRRETHLSDLTAAFMRVAETAIDAGRGADAAAVLTDFSNGELKSGLALVRDLVTGLSVQATGQTRAVQSDKPAGFHQIW